MTGEGREGWQVLLAFSGQRTGMLLNTPQCPGQPLTVKNSSKCQYCQGLLVTLVKWRCQFHKNVGQLPWPGGSADWSIVPLTKRLQVRFPVRAHAQVVGSIPCRGVYKKLIN